MSWKQNSPLRYKWRNALHFYVSQEHVQYSYAFEECCSQYLLISINELMLQETCIMELPGSSILRNLLPVFSLDTMHVQCSTVVKTKQITIKESTDAHLHIHATSLSPASRGVVLEWSQDTIVSITFWVTSGGSPLRSVCQLSSHTILCLSLLTASLNRSKLVEGGQMESAPPWRMRSGMETCKEGQAMWSAQCIPTLDLHSSLNPGAVKRFKPAHAGCRLCMLSQC